VRKNKTKPGGEMRITLKNYQQAQKLFRDFCEQNFGIVSPEWLSELVVDHIADYQNGVRDKPESTRLPAQWPLEHLVN
jgi:hypothetical protein